MIINTEENSNNSVLNKNMIKYNNNKLQQEIVVTQTNIMNTSSSCKRHKSINSIRRILIIIL